MKPQRPLTEAERRLLSPGLVAALEAAGVEPVIVPRPAWLARVAWLWRGHVPILTRGRRIYWPGALADFSQRPNAMAVLQHELQHVLDFSTGRLSALGYLLNPRNWTYRLPGVWDWARLGAEQRAVLAEKLWRAEQGLERELEACRRAIPWALARAEESLDVSGKEDGFEPSGPMMMTDDRWTAVDDYFAEALGAADPALEAALRGADAAGLPQISVSPLQGKLLHLLALTAGARRILEVGTLGGYSAIWMARALPPEGRLVTLEIDPRHAEVARAAIAEAGLAERVEVRVGPALELLPTVEGPFDLVFIDADKPSNPDYFALALKLTRPGGLIVVDNVVRGGAVAEADSADPAVLGVRRLAALVAAEPRVQATVLQTVGAKGWDGLLLARVVS